MEKRILKLKSRKYFRACKIMAVVAIICVTVRVQVHGRPVADRENASYTVWFTDEEDSSVWIFAPQSGEVEDGTVLTIPFPEKIVGGDGYYWSATEESPKKVEVYSPGNDKFYVQYRRGKKVTALQPPDNVGKKRLEYWKEKTWNADCLITGNDPLAEPEYNLIMENSGQNNRRLTNLVTMFRNLGEESRTWHYIYMIGLDYVPQTLILGNWPDVEYSSVTEETFSVEGSDCAVVRVGMRKRWSRESCPHHWSVLSEEPGRCLKFGVRNYICSLCDWEETVLLPPESHRDENGDSLCDACSQRTIEQKKGDRISAILQTKVDDIPMTFTCVDENYRGTGRMVYLSDHVLDVRVTGICFEPGEGNRYEGSSLRNYFRHGFSNDISLSQALLPLEQEDGIEDTAFLFTEEEYEKYRDDSAYKPVSTPFLLRTPEGGGKIRAVFPDGEVRGIESEGSTEAGVRPFIVLDTPVTGEEPERHYWKEGDVQVRVTGGKERFYRCIDEDYSDMQGTHRKSALFLCDDVIRSDEASAHFTAGTGEKTETEGRLSFGNTNNYKDSAVRKWLTGAANSDYLEPIAIGVTTAFAGITPEGLKENMNTDSLKRFEIGYQFMQDRLFCLSVEEALRYRDSLWKFGGSGENNEETQITTRSVGYYLRTPVYRTGGDGNFKYSDEIYTVNLERGNIRPVKADTTEMGVRPAFAMKQGD